ncbi:MAG: molybdate ABC transporter substrate-binding protein [Woeseiaceae bacterium]
MLLLGLIPCLSFAKDVVTIAVASNFARAAADIATEFTEQTGVRVRLSYGSTGKLYAQILNGAPYDIFMAADAQRPFFLEQSGKAVDGSRKTYATGSLVLWSADERLRGRDCRQLLEHGDYQRLALANPKTAPYGTAAREFLMSQNLWESASRRAAYGENIAQTLQFVATGNASLGIVAKAQTSASSLPAATCTWPIPESLHAPLRQQFVLLTRAGNNQGARQFLAFLQTPAAKQIIRQHGYRVSR